MSFNFVSEVSIQNISELKNYIQAEAPNWKLPCVVLLSGPMGAGKTEFVKQWGHFQGLNNISSPTYALHQQYKGADHFDLFRLQDESELETTGFWDLFSEPQGLIFIEWPEKMEIRQLPKSWTVFLYQISIQGNDRLIKKYIRN